MRQVFKLPDVGEGIAQAEIVEYLVKVGDKVKADQPVVRIETDKAVVELPSPVTGTVVEIPHAAGDTINVGEVIMVIEAEGDALGEVVTKGPEPRTSAPVSAPPAKQPDAKAEPTAAPQTAPPTEGNERQVLATPHTRKLARELKVDITRVTATGAHGRVTDEDVKLAASTPSPAVAKAAPSTSAPSVTSPSTAGFDFEKYGATRRMKMKGIRKRTAEVMARSKAVIPHVTHFDEADVTDLLAVVKREKALGESRGIKLTVLSFIAKAVVSALKLYPMLNCSLDEQTDELVYKDYYHIGFATDTDAGLMVPVVRDVDKKSVMQIAGDLQALSQRAHERSIDIEELRGGTFTITNIGSIGGKWATPIIVHPQVAILCALRAEPRPVVKDGEVVIRTIMPLTLAFDHRVLDGADAARFMNFIIGLMEDPMRMLVDIS